MLQTIKRREKKQKQKIHFGVSRNRIKVRSAEGGCAVALNVLAAFFILMIAGTNSFFLLLDFTYCSSATPLSSPHPVSDNSSHFVQYHWHTQRSQSKQCVIFKQFISQKLKTHNEQNL